MIGRLTAVLGTAVLIEAFLALTSAMCLAVCASHQDVVRGGAAGGGERHRGQRAQEEPRSHGGRGGLGARGPACRPGRF